MSRHYADTYYLPSWQGGDTLRALCKRGRIGITGEALTDDAEAVTCRDCRAAMPQQPAQPLAVVALPPPEPGMRQVAARVAAQHGLTVEQLRASRCNKTLAPARQQAMWEMHALGFSNAQIAGVFNLSDHTSVVHGRRRHQARLDALKVAA